LGVQIIGFMIVAGYFGLLHFERDDHYSPKSSFIFEFKSWSCQVMMTIWENNWCNGFGQRIGSIMFSVSDRSMADTMTLAADPEKFAILIWWKRTLYNWRYWRLSRFYEEGRHKSLIILIFPSVLDRARNSSLDLNVGMVVMSLRVGSGAFCPFVPSRNVSSFSLWILSMCHLIMLRILVVQEKT
jgi:hypothetical protein